MQRNSGNSQGSRGPRRGGRRRGLGGASNRSVPPPFIPTVGLSHKFRYGNGANTGSFSITRANLLNQIMLATSTVTTVRLFQAIRLKSVEVWGNPVALGSAPTGCSIEWTGENSPSTLVEDISMGVRPSHILSYPPPSSSNRWWSISGSTESDVLFKLVLTSNAVIDVTMELRYVDTEAPTAAETPVGATLGQVYGDYLDGRASGKLAPAGYTVVP